MTNVSEFIKLQNEIKSLESEVKELSGGNKKELQAWVKENRESICNEDCKRWWDNRRFKMDNFIFYFLFFLGNACFVFVFLYIPKYFREPEIVNFMAVGKGYERNKEAMNIHFDPSRYFRKIEDLTALFIMKIAAVEKEKYKKQGIDIKFFCSKRLSHDYKNGAMEVKEHKFDLPCPEAEGAEFMLVYEENYIKILYSIFYTDKEICFLVRKDFESFYNNFKEIKEI